MPACSSYGCTNRRSKNIPGMTFHRFPFSRPEVLQQWVKNVRRKNWSPTKRSSVLCSDHFESDCFDRTGCTIRLKSHAVPTIFSFTQRVKKRKGRVSWEEAAYYSLREGSRFPVSNKEKLRQWVHAVRRKNFEPTKHHFLCSEHFASDSYFENHTKRILKVNAVPTIFNFSASLKKKKRNRPSLDISLPSTSSAVESDNSIQESSEISIVDSYTIDETLERNAAEVKQESAAITGKDRQRARLKKTALPSLYLPVPYVDKNENSKEMLKQQHIKAEKNVSEKEKNDGAEAILLLSGDGSFSDLPAENPPTAEMVNPNIEESLPSAENVKKEFKTAPVTSPSFQKCCVRNCNSRQWIGTKIIFHKFPLENEELTRKWVENIGQEDFIPTVNDTICSRHFVVKDYINRHVSEKTLKNDAIPRVFDSEMQVDGETDSEEMLSSDNESMDSEEVLKRKVKKWKASYKESQRKLKEYKKLCKLYVKEVFTLREVITNLQQINSVTDGDYFEVKS